MNVENILLGLTLFLLLLFAFASCDCDEEDVYEKREKKQRR